MGWRSCFVMPAVFLLVMSFALKNTLLSQAIALADHRLGPRGHELGWRRFGRTTGSSATAVSASLRARCCRTHCAHARVRGRRHRAANGWVDAAGSAACRSHRALAEQPHPARRQPGACAPKSASRLLQLQLRSRAAAAGPFASILLEDAARIDLLRGHRRLTIRYLYEIESGRTDDCGPTERAGVADLRHVLRRDPDRRGC